MVIQIRIVIRVPDQENYAEKIDSIVYTVLREFPDAKPITSRSPVVVTIDEFQELTDKPNE